MSLAALDGSLRPSYKADSLYIPSEIFIEIFRAVLDIHESGVANLCACRLVSRTCSEIARVVLFRDLKFSADAEGTRRSLNTLRDFLASHPHIARCVQNVQLFDHRHQWSYSWHRTVPYMCYADPADVLATLQCLPHLRTVLFNDILPRKCIDSDLLLQRLPHLETVHVHIPHLGDKDSLSSTLVFNLLDIFSSIGELRISAPEQEFYCAYEHLEDNRQGPLALTVRALHLHNASPGFTRNLSLQPFVGALNTVVVGNASAAALKPTLLTRAVSLAHLTHLVQFDPQSPHDPSIGLADDLDLSLCVNLKSLTLRVHTPLPSSWWKLRSTVEALDSLTHRTIEALRSLTPRTVAVRKPLELVTLRSNVGGSRSEGEDPPSLTLWMSSLEELQNLVLQFHAQSRLKVIFYVTADVVQEIRTGLWKLDRQGILTIIPCDPGPRIWNYAIPSHNIPGLES